MILQAATILFTIHALFEAGGARTVRVRTSAPPAVSAPALPRRCAAPPAVAGRLAERMPRLGEAECAVAGLRGANEHVVGLSWPQS